jgi:hypothetical protein
LGFLLLAAVGRRIIPHRLQWWQLLNYLHTAQTLPSDYMLELEEQTNCAVKK